MKSIAQFALFGIAVISITACAKKFSQSDLDNARKEGVSSAQPSSNRVALLAAQKNFAPKARMAAYIADTMQQSLSLTNTAFYAKPEGKAEVKKWIETTKDAITTAFGAPTNTDGAKLGFGFQINTLDNGKYNKIIIGLPKVNKVATRNGNNGTPKDITGDSINHVDKSVTYTVGGQQFTFKKANNAPFVLSTGGSGKVPEYSITPVKLTWKNGAKEEDIADNLYTTSAILSAIQNALANAIDATK